MHFALATAALNTVGLSRHEDEILSRKRRVKKPCVLVLQVNSTEDANYETAFLLKQTTSCFFCLV